VISSSSLSAAIGVGAKVTFCRHWGTTVGYVVKIHGDRTWDVRALNAWSNDENLATGRLTLVEAG